MPAKRTAPKSVRKRKPARRPRRARRRLITPEDLLQFQIVSDPQISPDGTWVLLTKKHVGEKNEYVTNLWVVETDGGEPRQFTSGNKDSHGRWSPDGKRIAFISEREKAKPQVYVMSSDGGEAAKLTGLPQGRIQSFQWSPDGTLLAVLFRETDPEWTEEAKKQREESGASTPPRVIEDIYYREDGDGYFNDRRYHLYVVDAQTGAHRLLFRNRGVGFEYDWAPDSTELVVAANLSREPLLNWWKVDLFRVAAGTGKRTKIPHLPIGQKGGVRWSPDGRHIAYAGREDKSGWGVQNTHLYVCDAEQGQPRNLTGHTDYCLTAATLSDSADVAFGANLRFSPDGSRIYMELGWHGESHLVSISTDGGEMTFHTQGRQAVQMGNFSADGRRIALTVADATALPEVAVGSVQMWPTRSASRARHSRSECHTFTVTPLTAFNAPLLGKLQLAEPKPHWIESADGNKVHVWVMKPPASAGGNQKKHPAVLEIHGGPHCQYGEAFFHEFQVLAAAGYVIVFSNPRGSKGYGEAHCAAIKGNWGAADWRDIQAVIGFMQKQPDVDAKRMGVMGGSYGGYMTNWVIGHCDDFAAAVTDRCVSNLVSMVGSSDFPLVPGEYWDANSWDKTEPLWSQSPLKYFANVNTPTLIIHSEGDLRCNVEQGEQVFAALKLRGVPTRFVRYPAETSHGLSRGGPPDLRLHRLHQILSWWKKYLS